MKKRIFFIFAAVLLVFGLLPSNVLATDSDGNGYNDHDEQRLRAFLEQESAVAGEKNGQRINPDGYDANDPSTWKGVTWSSNDEKSVAIINWIDKSLAGSFDISGCAHIWRIYCQGNAIKSINITDMPRLRYLFCNDNEIETLIFTKLPELRDLFCYNNRLECLDYIEAENLVGFDSRGNKLKQLKVSLQGGTIELDAVGDGYVELHYQLYARRAIAKGSNNVAFLGWTDEDGNKKLQTVYNLTIGTDYKLTANFDTIQPVWLIWIAAALAVLLIVFAVVFVIRKPLNKA